MHLLHLGPHRMVTERNLTYSNHGVIVKPFMAFSGMLRAGVRTTGTSVPLSTVTSCLALPLTQSQSTFPVINLKP